MDYVAPPTPTFVLPYKRYASPDLLERAKQYVDTPELSLRQATSAGKCGRRIVYDNDPKASALSHSTLHRWLTFLGAMTTALAVGCELFLLAHPESDVHRFAGAVDPNKGRNELRLKALRIARRLLHLRYQWDREFKETPFFPRFATSGCPP